MHEEYRDRGFEIIAFPSNTFGNEPDRNRIVNKFIRDKYEADFHMI